MVIEVSTVLGWVIVDLYANGRRRNPLRPVYPRFKPVLEVGVVATPIIQSRPSQIGPVVFTLCDTTASTFGIRMKLPTPLFASLD